MELRSHKTLFCTIGYQLYTTFLIFVVAPILAKLMDRGGDNPHPYTQPQVVTEPPAVLDMLRPYGIGS